MVEVNIPWLVRSGVCSLVVEVQGGLPIITIVFFWDLNPCDAARKSCILTTKPLLLLYVSMSIDRFLR